MVIFIQNQAVFGIKDFLVNLPNFVLISMHFYKRKHLSFSEIFSFNFRSSVNFQYNCCLIAQWRDSAGFFRLKSYQQQTAQNLSCSTFKSQPCHSFRQNSGVHVHIQCPWPCSCSKYIYIYMNMNVIITWTRTWTETKTETLILTTMSWSTHTFFKGL
jgi:hypothetical protein